MVERKNGSLVVCDRWGRGGSERGGGKNKGGSRGSRRAELGGLWPR